MWPDRVSNPGSLTLESDALSTALRGSAIIPRSSIQTAILLHGRLHMKYRYKKPGDYRVEMFERADG